MATDGRADEVTPAVLAGRIEAGEAVDLLDARNRDELDAWRIEGLAVEVTRVSHTRLLSASATTPRSWTTARTSSSVRRARPSAGGAGMLAESGVEAVNLVGEMEGWARGYRRERVDG